VRNRAFAACAEFPNDNPVLHGGAIWFCAQVVGPAVFEAPEAPERVQAADLAMLEAPVEGMTPDPRTDPAPPVLEAEDPGDDIEIVEDLALDGFVDEPVAGAPGEEAAPQAAPPASTSTAAPAEEPFGVLARLMDEVARAAGADDAALAALRTMTGRERLPHDAPGEQARLRAQAAAWQAVLRGESEDFGACGGGALDEWSALVVASALGEAAKTDGLRRELRRRGVAAFGLIEDAA
jgi:hypothetical protein